MNETALQTKKLTKRYRSFTALDNADMTVMRGDIYGLIGRNGAGKTTLMKTVVGLTNATSGEFSVFGKTGREAGAEKCRIGCLIEAPAFYGSMTAYRNLRYYCIQKGITDLKKIDEALDLVKLTDAKNKQFKKFSLGMKQRLGIAFALLDDPDLVILDEPINGLDPIGISELRDTFRRLNREKGITFVISSHILSELYAVANRFLIIDKGKVLKEMTKEELDLECSRCISINLSDVKKAAIIIENKLNVADYKVISDNEIRIYDRAVKPDVLNKLMVENDVSVERIFETGITIEDYFRSLVGGEQA